MATPRKYPGFPVDLVWTHPVVITLSAGAYGMLWRLLVQFWMSECRDLPTCEEELRSIVRAHRPTWAQHKGAVLTVFQDIKPVLIAKREAWLNLRNGLSFSAQKAVKAREAKRQVEKSVRSETFLPSQLPHQREKNRVQKIAERGVEAMREGT